MIVTLVDANGKPVYTGNEINARVATLMTQGYTRVDSTTPDEFSVWNGSAWVADDMLKKTKLKADLIEQIEAEATRRVELLGDSVKSRGKQVASLAIGALLLGKKVDGNITPSEQAALDGLKQIATAVQSIDAARDALIASLDSMMVTQLESLDVKDNQYWP